MTSILFLTEAIYCNIFRCNYLRNENLFLNFFLHFRNFDSILFILKKRPPSWLIYFWTYGLRKTRLDKCLESPFSEELLKSNIVKWNKTLLEYEPQHLYHIYWSLSRQFSWKKSLSVVGKILGLFVHILTADDKYSLLNRDNLLQHLQMQLSQK